MSLSKIANLVYKNSSSLTINKENYTDNVFTQKWLQTQKEHIKSNTPGWYWITTTMPFEDFINLKANKDKKKSGCDIATVFKNSKAIFNDNLLCKTNFYNGHAATITSRLQAHFNLKNNDTGALGLNAYDDFKEYEIKVNYFSEDCILKSQLNDMEKERIQQLITTNIGRTAIENAWRADNGFPILCKH